MEPNYENEPIVEEFETDIFEEVNQEMKKDQERKLEEELRHKDEVWYICPECQVDDWLPNNSSICPICFKEIDKDDKRFYKRTDN